MVRKEFWRDGEYKARGGIWYRSFDLNQFLEKVEKQGKEIVGIAFEGNNCEIIVKEDEEKKEKKKENS